MVRAAGRRQLHPSVVDKIPSGIGETLALTAARRITGRPVAIGYCAEAPQSANVWHVYPRDGLDVFSEHLAAELDGQVRLETPVEAIHLDGDRVVGVRAGGRDLEAAAVMSDPPRAAAPRGSWTIPRSSRSRNSAFAPWCSSSSASAAADLLPDP